MTAPLTEGSTPDPRTTPLLKWTAEADHDGFFPIGILIAPNGNRYTVATEDVARSMARTLNAGPAADALAKAVDDAIPFLAARCIHFTTSRHHQCEATHRASLTAALAAYRKASEEPPKCERCDVKAGTSETGCDLPLGHKGYHYYSGLVWCGGSGRASASEAHDE